MIGVMNQIRFIRTRVFNVTQAEFAGIAAVGQATVSRWENDDGDPSLGEMWRILQEARARSLELPTEWFFELPAHAAGDEHVRSLVRDAFPEKTDGATE